MPVFWIHFLIITILLICGPVLANSEYHEEIEYTFKATEDKPKYKLVMKLDPKLPDHEAQALYLG